MHTTSFKYTVRPSILHSADQKRSPNDHVKKDEIGRACGTYRKNTNAYRVLVNIKEVPNEGWENNTKMDLEEII